MGKSWLHKPKGKSSYYVFWKEEGKLRRRSTGTADLAEAVEAKKKIDAERNLSNIEPIAEAITRFCQVGKAEGNQVPRYQRNREQYLRRFHEWVGKDSLTEITTSDIANFKEYLLIDLGRNHSTINHFLVFLNTFFDWCQETGRASSNPVAGVKRCKGGVGKKRTTVTDEEFAAVLDEATEIYTKAALCLMRYSGMRNGEIVNLQWRDIEEDRGRVHIVHDPPERHVKGKQSRFTMLTPDTLFFLRSWQSIAPTSNWIFCHPDGSKMKSIFRSLNSSFDRAGIDKTAYCLRHTFTTDMLTKLPPAVVQYMVGHSSLRTTDGYNHQSWDQAEQSLKMAGSPIGFSPGSERRTLGETTTPQVKDFERVG